MSSNFECVIKISGHTFDIAIADLKSKEFLSFGNIYPKIREISRLAANEVIQLNTHSFEIIYGREKYEVNRLDQFIRNNSVISIAPKRTRYSLVDSHSNSTPLIARIIPPISTRGEGLLPTPKPIPKASQLTPIVAKNTPNPTVVKQTLNSNNKLQKSAELLKNKPYIELFHWIVLSIKSVWVVGKSNDANWQLVHRHVNCQLTKVPRVQVSGVYSLIPGTYQQLAAYFYTWASYYAKNYYTMDRMLDSSDQQIFDLLKVVHILDLSQVYKKASNKSAKMIKEIIASNPDIDISIKSSLPQKTKQVVRPPIQLKGSSSFGSIDWSKEPGYNDQWIPTDFDRKMLIKRSLPQKNKTKKVVKQVVKHSKQLERSPSVESIDWSKEPVDEWPLLNERQMSLRSVPKDNSPQKNSSFVSDYNRVKDIVFKSMDKSVEKSLNITNNIINNNSIPHYMPSKSVPTNRIPSTVEIVLPPKKTISLSEYKKLKENPSHFVDKSEENSSNSVPTNRTPSTVEVVLPSKKTPISLCEYQRLLIKENPSHFVDKSKENSSNESGVPSDPRLKRRLELTKTESLSKVESMAEKRIKSQPIEVITI